MILSRTPLRITLAGGGTDLPSFYSKNEGFVVSMAINKYIYLTFKEDFFETDLKLRYSNIEIVKNVYELKNHRAKEALLLHGIKNSCEINSCADLPSNTGLGSSGSFLVGLLNLVREYKRLNTEPKILADEACDIEINRLNEPVGKQDQYIAAFGGIKIFEIDKKGNVSVNNLQINQNTLKELISNTCIYFLNVKRDASEVLVDQKNLKGNSEELLKIIKKQAYQTVEYLKNSDLDSYGKIMDEYWNLKKQLSNKISIPIVDEIYETVKKDFNVLGGKIIGAGGGGFLMLYCNKNHLKLDEFMKSAGYSRLHFNIDNIGSTILGNFSC
jgi:D-glycero-alpha-D-manno-heptose-7-phosphate kinase